MNFYLFEHIRLHVQSLSLNKNIGIFLSLLTPRIGSLDVNQQSSSKLV